tara:strand:- start:396 stop:1340 length:945 start_codon:yes stop_codon:yes gene_type:complete
MKLLKPKFWDYSGISLWSILLLPLSITYLFVIWIIRILSVLKKYEKKPYPIICVGNIYLGGTGKTPLAIEIFNIVTSLGNNPVFVKKYYDYLKDEIEMLKETGSIFATSAREDGIAQSIKYNHDVIILDDGFQDFTIRPNFSILCFNSKQLIGNGFVIPSGPLREPLSAVFRADCIFINGEKNKKTLEFEEKILRNIRKKKLHLFYSKYKIKNIEKFKDKNITAFAGIGNPKNFFDLLIENKLKLKKTYSFPDHHNYSQKDFDKIFGDKSTKIVTTKKDYYRMNSEQKKYCDYIDVDLEIENKKEFERLIKQYI